jgi:hypothetical protein
MPLKNLFPIISEFVLKLEQHEGSSTEYVVVMKRENSMNTKRALFHNNHLVAKSMCLL